MKPKTPNWSLHKIVILLIAGAAIAVTILYWSGCRDAAPGPPPEHRGGAEVPAATVRHEQLRPIEVIRRVHQWRLEGRTAALRPYIVPEQRDAVIEHVFSIDELISAGASLRARVERLVGAGSAESFDRTAVADMAGPFSRNVECVSETISGETAVVRIRVGDRLPLEKIELVWRDDRWMIRTDPPVPGISAELRNLAQALRRVADAVEHRALSPHDIEKELALRQRPVLRRINRLLAEVPPAGPAGEP